MSRRILLHNQPKSPTPTNTIRSFLHHNYQPNPRPLNPATSLTTTLVASDRAHPLYPQVQRELQAFNPGLLHWRVRTSNDLSPRGVVRSWALRRVKVALLAELRERGFARDGRKLDGGEGDGLRGALSVIVDRGGGAIRASGVEVRREVGKVLDAVMRAHKRDRDEKTRGLTAERAGGAAPLRILRVKSGRGDRSDTSPG
ncbi:hypothetical protein BDY17DRAFT_304301 [Neohortaea acidophila]|uniref:Uncharacterized protein n=1 Tax=Neohortaea acidophila TaxID=245834 RepID=A0A6A6PHX8_9PEZI|nr:uncharacterized protein BDY17DRAFT_304301 [Neohortaea acidophila]KAF2479620.1 hypothetical protein BDY17DRAFT_304301 [Neohortaea acidophila]